MAVLHVSALDLTLEFRIRNLVVIKMFFEAKVFCSRLNVDAR